MAEELCPFLGRQRRRRAFVGDHLDLAFGKTERDFELLDQARRAFQIDRAPAGQDMDDIGLVEDVQ